MVQQYTYSTKKYGEIMEIIHIYGVRDIALIF